MDELVYKRDVIKAICEDGTWLESQGCTEITMAERKQRDVDIIEDLPPVQPNHNAEVSKMVDDLISRQAAIDAIHCDITVTGRQNAELVAVTIGAFADRIKALPPVQPETCEGCKHLGKWENEVEYGYPSPCTRCKRRAEDHYER